MGRIRTIKPEFFKHAELYDAEQETGLPLRVAYAGLWTCCDREGRFKWRPRELKLDVLPFDECDFSRVLDALATRGFLVKYASPTRQDEHFGFVPTWRKNQFINNREPKSSLPEPVSYQHVDACSTRESRVPDACPTDVVKERKGREGKDACSTREVWDGFDVSRAVRESLSISGRALTTALDEVCKAEMKNGAKPERLIADMVAAFQDYAGKVEFEKSPENFFGGGTWKKRGSWKFKNGFHPKKKENESFIPSAEL